MNKIITHNFYRYQIILEYINKQRQNAKFVQSFEIGITFFLSSFFLFFAIKPTSNTISTLMGDIKSKQALVKQMRTKINNVIQAQDVFSQIQTNYQLIDACLPDNPRFTQGLAQIKGSVDTVKTIDKYSIDLNPVLVNSAVGPTFPNQFTIPLKIETNFQNALTLFEKLTHTRRLIIIDNLTLNLAKTDNTGQSLTGGNLIFSTNPKLFYSQSTNVKN